MAIYIYTRVAGPILTASNRGVDCNYSTTHYDGRNKVLMEQNIRDCLKMYNNETGIVPPNISLDQFNYIMDNLVSKNTLEDDIIVYRGVDKLFFNEEEILKFQKGTLINDKAHLSTSVVKDSVHKKHKYCLKIKVPKGTNAACLETYAGVSRYNQQELLLGRNTLLKVIGYPMLDDNTGMIEIPVEVVPNSGNTIEIGSNPFQYISSINNINDRYSNMYGVTSGISLEALVNEMKSMGIIERYNSEVDDMVIRGLYSGNIPIVEHDLQHVKNVLLYSMYMGKKSNLSQQDFDILIEAAKYHDVGLVNASNHKNHSELSSQVVERYLKNLYSDKDIKFIRALIEYHEQTDSKTTLNRICNNLEIYDLNEISRIKILADILKDSDALDRTRFPGNFDKSFLRNSISKQLMLSSFELRELLATDQLSNYINSGVLDSNKIKKIEELRSYNIPNMIIFFALKYYSYVGYNNFYDYAIKIMSTGKMK